VTQVKARWLGHRLYGEVSLAVEPELSVAAGDAIASRLRAHLRQQLPYLAEVTIQVQPQEPTAQAL
jgi:divalent metal cation (Fe/Co/Zn/Cd) transporter